MDDLTNVEDLNRVALSSTQRQGMRLRSNSLSQFLIFQV